jgi:hypothetical protein
MLKLSDELPATMNEGRLCEDRGVEGLHPKCTLVQLDQVHVTVAGLRRVTLQRCEGAATAAAAVRLQS